MIFFNYRKMIADDFEKWAKENQAKDCAFNVISYLEAFDLLDEEEVYKKYGNGVLPENHRRQISDKAVIDGLRKQTREHLVSASLFAYVEEAIYKIFDIILIKKVLEDKLMPSNEKVKEIEFILKMGKTE